MYGSAPILILHATKAIGRRGGGGFEGLQLAINLQLPIFVPPSEAVCQIKLLLRINLALMVPQIRCKT